MNSYKKLLLLFAVLSLSAYDGLRPGYSPEQSKSSFKKKYLSMKTTRKDISDAVFWGIVWCNFVPKFAC